MEVKKRFKMYKAGKNWVIAPLVFFGLVAGMQVGLNTVSADESNQPTATVVDQDDKTSTERKTDATGSELSDGSQGAIDQQQQGTAENNTEQQIQDAAQNTSESLSTNSSVIEQSDDAATKYGNEAASQNDTQTQQQVSEAKTATDDDTKSSSTSTTERDNSVDSSEVKRSAGGKDKTLVKHGPAKLDNQNEPKQVKENGYWYLRDQKGNNLTGFQNIKNQNKRVYYNQQGRMQYGEQKIQSHWYLFDQMTGAMQTGFKQVKAAKNSKKTVYYASNGQMQYGEHQINKKWYLFDDKSGAMKTGFQKLVDRQGRNKTSYYAANGQMQYGQKKLNNHWYNFDRQTGAMSTGITKLPNKTVYYAANGQMRYGQQKVANHWYLFDTVTGAMKKGFQRLKAPQRTVYYAANGQMQYGEKLIRGKWYLFDKLTGAMKTGFQKLVDGKGEHKTSYYSSNGQMQYGQKIINGSWYLFDSVTGAMKVGFQKIANQNKTVYYDVNSGKMLKGQQKINNRWYLFDQSTGARKTGLQVIEDQKKIVFYDLKSGQMQYGTVLMDNQSDTEAVFYFDKQTGALKTIGDKSWYDEALNDMPVSYDDHSMNTVDGYLSWTGWYRPRGIHQNGQKWVSTSESDWRPYMLYIWPSKDIEAQYIKYFVNHGYVDASTGLTSIDVAGLNGATSNKTLNGYARKLRDAVEKEVYKNNYSTGNLASTMDAFIATVPDFNGLSELPVEKEPGYKPDHSGTVDNDQIIFVNSGEGNQKQGSTTNADSKFRNMNYTIWNQYGNETGSDNFGPELLVGNDIDNSNPIVQAENINWEYYLLKYGEINGYGKDANFDGFRNDAADNIDADVLDQQAQLLNDMFGLKDSESNANSHLVYNEGYHSGAASMLGAKDNQQLYMDSQEFYTLLNTLGKAAGQRDVLGNLITNSVVNRQNDTNDNQAQPNWSFVTNHDQRKNVINQMVIDSHPGVTDIMGDSYKPEYAEKAWKEYYQDQLKTNKKYAIYNVLSQYAILLSNKDTVPQLYYGDMYDETKAYMESKSIYYDGIVNMLKARQKYVAGGQSYQSYGDNLVASVRYGKGNNDVNSVASDTLGRNTGIAVIVSNDPSMKKQTITVAMGKAHANQKYMNIIDTIASSSKVEGVTFDSSQVLTTDSKGNLIVTVQGYANPLVSGYLGVWVPFGASAGQVATTSDSTTKKQSGKIYESNAALDSHVIYEDFSLYQPNFTDIHNSAYVKIADTAQDFSDLGITDFWMAPPYTSFSMSRYNEGYSTNDRYTLGTEANPTKYGTGAQLAEALQAIHAAGMQAQVDLVMNQMLGFPTQEAVTVSRTDNYGNPLSVDGKTFANEVYLAYTIGGGEGQTKFGGKFLNELQQLYPDLFATKAKSTGIAPDPTTHITQWSAKYQNGTSTQNVGIGRVMKNKDGSYYYVESTKDHLLQTQLPSEFTSDEDWLANGDQSRGWVRTQHKVYYLNADGSVALGQKKIGNSWYMFDEKTGVMQKGFVSLPKAKKTVYYDLDGKMMYGEQKINNHWYYFDKVTGSMAKGFKKVSGKTVYYNSKGQMLYGRQVINGKTYFFDTKTGALKK
ncbi:dextransucrase [Ligilactobacillus salitolerans]|uniref:dextransucrase n=1 Tax=Ligilactobacillus salitolerans TaxID=1808352 RepID=A0A401IW29_9LACO|nr:glycoside hydrolase family 70 protein [Ligilactobacillus salitolerans]GBG95722.1 dextransucrase [Ligilactobacillus salitolerans]